MNCSRKDLIRHLRDIILVTLIGTLVSLLFIIKDLTWHNLLINTIYCAILGSSIWKGNELLGSWIDRRYPWQHQPGKTLTINIIGMVLFSVFDIFLVNFIWFHVAYKIDFWQFFLYQGGYWIVVVQMLITFIIALTLYVSDFFKAWRESVKNEEKFKRESLAFQYESLKNQVNPHFLFNSLNVLSSLVMKDQEGSVQFIRQLSEVYRYVLEQKDREVVDLDTELRFVESYIYLQKIRYTDNLIIDISPDVSAHSGMQVIPMSVQMLVENAIKHNIISAEEPLTIMISMEEGYLTVRNNLQARHTVPETGNIGLKNIKSRYEYLTDKEFQVINNGKEFVVKVPLVKYTSPPSPPLHFGEGVGGEVNR